MAQKPLSNKKKPPNMARTDTSSILSILQAEHQKELEELVLTKRPFETMKLFALAILQYLKQLALYVINRWASFSLLTTLGIALGVMLIMLDGPHDKLVNEFLIYLRFGLWWLGLGVASSIGLGSGLHTFVLYLGPHIAFFTLKATQCGRVDLKSAPYDTILLNRVPSWIEKDCSEIGPPLYQRFLDSERFRTPLHSILPHVQLEAVLWGIGTALGELPPYFVSRAACLSGKKLEDLERLNAPVDESGTVSVWMMRLKCWFYSKSRHLNFFTILILASDDVSGIKLIKEWLARKSIWINGARKWHDIDPRHAIDTFYIFQDYLHHLWGPYVLLHVPWGVFYCIEGPHSSDSSHLMLYVMIL